MSRARFGLGSAADTRASVLLPLGTGWSLAFWGLTVASLLPILLADHPPLQDLPQHLAAISVLRHYPSLNLGDYFEIGLARTQYLAYYGFAYLLSFPLGITLANKLLLCVSIAALPWSLCALLRSLGRDGRLAVFAFALTYNAHLVLGFFNFIAALPLMFAGLAAAVHLRQADLLSPRETAATNVSFWARHRRELTLGTVLVLCFYTHVVPFAFLGLGSALVLWGDGLLPTLRRARVFVPAGIAAIVWLALTPAGQSTLAAAGGAEGKRGAQFNSVSQAVRELPMWLTDVLSGERDEQLWVAWLALLVTALALGLRDRPEGAAQLNDELAFRLGLLCPLALLAYFVAPTGYDWIWPISARFPLLASLFACLLVPPLRGLSGQLVCAAAALVALLGFQQVDRAFAAFEDDEVGEIDAALAEIPAGERVAGLIFDRGSKHVKFAPFLHYVALYQAAKGGAVMFSFADFPQSPFRYREGQRPPRVPPRWEWQPERVDPRELRWFRYVLVRGGPGKIGRPGSPFRAVFEGSHWRVFQRVE